jgi:hypothetical protein
MAFKAKTDKGHRSRTTDEAIAEAAKETQKGITIYLPESLHRKFKAKTSERGEWMKDVLLKAIEDYVEN